MKYKIILLFLLSPLMVMFFSSCAKENDALVNPPLLSETVKIRFLNLSGDETPKTLMLEKERNFENVAFKTISSPQPPPYDSVLVEVYDNNNNLLLANQKKQKFSRKTNYIFIALPSRSDSQTVKPVDTLFVLQTTIIKPPDTNQCYLKFLNANPDATTSYSLALGCPNGPPIFSYMRYCQSSVPPYNLYEGKRVVSITKNISGSDSSQKKIVGIFEIDVKRLGQYVLIVDKHDNVYFIDELATEQECNLQPLGAITDRKSYVRIVNLSSETVTVSKSQSGELVKNLNPNFIDKYNTISACEGTNADKLTLECNGNITDSVYASFDIYKKYSTLIFDMPEAKASKLLVVPPIDDRIIKTSDKAIVRIINANYKLHGINVSIGGRTINNEYGYISGEILTTDLQENGISKEKSISGGNIPIAVFTSTAPTKYLFSANISIENGKEYLIAIDFSGEEGKLFLIEQDEEEKPISPATQAAFLQVVNTMNDKGNITVGIPNIINSGKVVHGSSIATFVPIGANSITINGKTHNYDVQKNNMALVIATNYNDNVEIFDVQSPTMGADASKTKFRFINASVEVPILEIDWDTQPPSVVAKDINYKTTSYTLETYRDRKFAFVFRNQETSTELLKVADLLVTVNKNYSIIFYGDKKSGYGIIIIQQY